MTTSVTEIPDRFICPILGEPFTDPVRARACHPSHVFERSAIEHGQRCPYRDGFINDLESQDDLRREVQGFRRDHPELFEEENEEELQALFQRGQELHRQREADMRAQHPQIPPRPRPVSHHPASQRSSRKSCLAQFLEFLESTINTIWQSLRTSFSVIRDAFARTCSRN